MKEHFNVLILASPVPTARFAGIARFAHENGWYLTIEDRHCPPTDWQCDGVITLLSEKNEALAEAVQRYRRRKIPVVDMQLARPDIALPRVAEDDDSIGILAAEHFSERAFTNLAWYSSKNSPAQEARYDAFAKGIPNGKPAQWIWGDADKAAAAGIGDGRLRWLKGKLAKAPRPLGVFCNSDYDASCVLNACLEAGISVPDEVAILGIGDNEIRCENLPVPLSSVRLDYSRAGYETAELLHTLMTGGKVPAEPRLVLPLGVTPRRSTETIAARDPILRDALVFIADNFTKPLSASKIAKAVGTTRFRLNAAFAAELDRSPGDEVMRRRLAKARYLLTETNTKVTEIPQQTGFCNAPYLIRSFKKVYGMSPSVWRRREAATRKGRAGF